MIQPVKKGKGISVMIWAAFFGALGRSDLIVMERDPKAPRVNTLQSLTSEFYLEEQIPRIWEPGLIFMEDNAPIHKASIITKFLEENGVKALNG